MEFSNNRYVKHLPFNRVISTYRCANGQTSVEDCRSMEVIPGNVREIFLGEG